VDRPDPLPLPVKRLDPELPLPTYATPGDAGLDLVAREGVVLKAAGGRARIPTGIALAIPEGWAGLVLPRSGLALKHGITCLNAPGLVDSGYRGEILVLLVNTDPAADFEIHRGDRIAQLVIQRVEHVQFVETDDLDDTDRGANGWGSSGHR
jgi:dUTP pyrophosphatase